MCSHGVYATCTHWSRHRHVEMYVCVYICKTHDTHTHIHLCVAQRHTLMLSISTSIIGEASVDDWVSQGNAKWQLIRQLINTHTHTYCGLYIESYSLGTHCAIVNNWTIMWLDVVVAVVSKKIVSAYVCFFLLTFQCCTTRKTLLQIYVLL